MLNTLRQSGIVPVVKIDDSNCAVRLAEAVKEGGIPIVEITFRTGEAEEAIRRIRENVPNMIVGAGTVLTVRQVDKAVSAGAQFIVTPGFNREIVDYCIGKGIMIIPGCLTPSEMEQAICRNIQVIKFFPAEQAGGLAYLKAVAQPYSMLRFMPTGGIKEGNLESYLSYDKIIACGGSWMVNTDLINQGKYEEITKLCAQAVAIVKKVR